MALRRYSEMKPSRGTVIPHDMKLFVYQRDAKATGGCVGFGRFPVECFGALEPDHVRASGGMGMKSVTCPCNLVAVCSACHRWKTEHGRDARPIELDYLSQFGYTPHVEGHIQLTEHEPLDEHTHVEPVYGCKTCSELWA